MTETAERKCLVEHLGGGKGAKTEPMLLFDDAPVAGVCSVDIADIKQRVASMTMHRCGLLSCLGLLPCAFLLQALCHYKPVLFVHLSPQYLSSIIG